MQRMHAFHYVDMSIVDIQYFFNSHGTAQCTDDNHVALFQVLNPQVTKPFPLNSPAVIQSITLSVFLSIY